MVVDPINRSSVSPRLLDLPFNRSIPAPTPEDGVYAPRAPWPCMRGDRHNSGVLPALRAATPVRSSSPAPRPSMHIARLHTGNAVFATPVIDAQERIYVGSADRHFYAFDPVSQRDIFRFATREVNDSAAALAADGSIFVPSGDGRIYKLNAAGEQVWAFDAARELRGFSPSTIYWWEGNCALGPHGRLFAGNDDFYIHAVDTATGERLWEHPTGLNVWSTPAFDDDNTLYCASFDMHVYALDSDTGALRWRTCVDNLVAGSPALDDNGGLYIGTFGREVMKLDSKTGAILWRTPVGGHVYASAAVAPNNSTIYVGAADGVFRAFDATTGAVQWSFNTGDAVRGSASLGPDPAGRASYLIYVGSGNGHVFAFAPDGRRRWSYDTCVDQPQVLDRNINASVALGGQGLAVACASGDVVWIPYAYYLHGADLRGFNLDPTDGLRAREARLVPLTVGGLPHEGDVLTVRGAQTLSFALQSRDDVTVDLSDVEVEITPPLAHRVVVHPGGRRISVVPEQLLQTGQTYTVRVRAGGETTAVEHTVHLRSEAVSGAPTLQALKEQPLRISHISVHEPSIIASFDQIGLAGLAVDVQVVNVNPETGALTAWGVLNFGRDADGTTQGVTHARSLRFAMGGTYRDGHFILTAQQPWFEITAFPVPLDALKVTGVWPRGNPEGGGSVVAEVSLPDSATLRQRTWPVLRQLAGAGSITGHHLTPWWNTLRMLWRAADTARRLLMHGPHRAWDLTDAQGHFVGVGTYRCALAPEGARQPTATVDEVVFDAATHTVQCTLWAADEQRTYSVLVEDTAGKPVAVDYNALTTTRMHDATCEVTLTLPKGTLASGRQFSVWVLEDTVPVQQGVMFA